MTSVIFSIDGEENLRTVKRFQDFMADKDIEFKMLSGSYEGRGENAWLVNEDGFEAIWKEGWVYNQESVLEVSSCNKQYATLRYLSGASTEALGSLCEVSEEEALAQDSWTYDRGTDVYYVCKKENPDRESQSARDQRELWTAVSDVLLLWENFDSALYSDVDAAMDALASVAHKQKPKWIK